MNNHIYKQVTRRILFYRYPYYTNARFFHVWFVCINNVFEVKI